MSAHPPPNGNPPSPSATRVVYREVHTTTRDQVVSVILALANVPAFAFLLFAAFIHGPTQFFGEYSRSAGHQAIASLVVTLVAAVAWGFFFASHSRAGRASIVGFIVVGAAITLATAVIVSDVHSLAQGIGDRGLEDGRVPWELYVYPLAWATVAACAAAALRRRARRVLLFTPALLIAVAWLAVAARELLQGGAMNPYLLAVLLAPLAVVYLLVDVVFSDRTRTVLPVAVEPGQ